MQPKISHAFHKVARGTNPDALDIYLDDTEIATARKTYDHEGCKVKVTYKKPADRLQRLRVRKYIMKFWG